MVKKNIASRVLLAIVGLIVAVVIAWFSWHLIVKPLLNIIPTVGETITSRAVNAPNWLVSLLGSEVFASWNALIIFLAVLMILLFAFADIISTFSSFSETTSWIIAGGLAIIGMMTGVLNQIIVVIFGGAAAFGALGIALIVIWAVVVAVAVNFFVGLSGMKAMKAAKMDGEQIADATRNMRKGYGKLKGAAEMDE